jgi:chromosomal replication initiation ATPase DnaA
VTSGLAPRQMALDLGHRPALGHEDFLVTDANANAVRWLDAWPDWPGNGLIVHGPPGCGKSHLVHVFRARSSASIALPRDFQALAEQGGDHPAVVVEDVDRVEEGDHEYLLHAFNTAIGAGMSMLMTARTPPAEWNVPLADLRSRIRALPSVAIFPPDDALLAAVMVKLLRDRQLRVEATVVEYLVPRMERSFSAARRVVDALDQASLSRRREVTVSLARDVVSAWATEEEQ